MCAATGPRNQPGDRRSNARRALNTQEWLAAPRAHLNATLRRTVLVIDHDASIRCVITDFLADAGYAVEQASDGASGLEMAEQVRPDLILLDLALPMRSGLAVLQQLKNRQPTREIPVIIVSAYAMLLIGDQKTRTSDPMQDSRDLNSLLNRVNEVVRDAHPRFRLLPPTS